MELTERLRQVLFLVVAILALVCFFASFMLFASAAYIKIIVDARMQLIETYQSNVLPAVFLFVGVVNLVQNVVCIFVVLKLRNIENRKDKMKMMMYVLIGGVVLVIFELGTCIASFVHIGILDDEFKLGLNKAMAEYSKGGELKTEMDTVQMSYSCCGDVAYTDWFRYSWLDPEYMYASKGAAKKYYSRDGKYYSDDTPFSCCDMHAPRPCVHHHIHDNSRHYNYNFMVETTLFVKGCRPTLMAIYSRVLSTVAVIALLIALVKITALLLFRLLHTSLLLAQEANDWQATTPAYIYYLRPPDPELEKKLKEGESTEGSATETGGTTTGTDVSVSGTDASKTGTDTSITGTDTSVTGTDTSVTGTDTSKTGTETSIAGTDTSITETDASKTGTDTSKTGTDTSITGTDASKTETDASKTGTDTSKSETDASKSETEGSKTTDTEASKTSDSEAGKTGTAENKTDNKTNKTDNEANKTDNKASKTDKEEIKTELNKSDMEETNIVTAESDAKEVLSPGQAYNQFWKFGPPWNYNLSRQAIAGQTDSNRPAPPMPRLHGQTNEQPHYFRGDFLDNPSFSESERMLQYNGNASRVSRNSGQSSSVLAIGDTDAPSSHSNRDRRQSSSRHTIGQHQTKSDRAALTTSGQDKKVHFGSSLNPPMYGPRNFAQKVLARLTPRSGFPNLFRRSTDSYRYSLVNAESDIDEEDEAKRERGDETSSDSSSESEATSKSHSSIQPQHISGRSARKGEEKTDYAKKIHRKSLRHRSSKESLSSNSTPKEKSFSDQSVCKSSTTINTTSSLADRRIRRLHHQTSSQSFSRTSSVDESEKESSGDKRGSLKASQPCSEVSLYFEEDERYNSVRRRSKSNRQGEARAVATKLTYHYNDTNSVVQRHFINETPGPRVGEIEYNQQEQIFSVSPVHVQQTQMRSDRRKSGEGDSERDSEMASVKVRKNQQNFRHQYQQSPYPLGIIQYESVDVHEFDLIPTIAGHSELPQVRSTSVDIFEKNVQVVCISPSVTVEESSSLQGPRYDHRQRKRQDKIHKCPDRQTFESNNQLDGRTGHGGAGYGTGTETRAAHGKKQTSSHALGCHGGDAHAWPVESSPAEVSQFSVAAAQSNTTSYISPILMASSSPFEFKVRNHVRSYQRRNVIIASPVITASANIPISQVSPHAELFNSPFLSSPMETSTPLHCSRQPWRSTRSQTTPLMGDVTPTTRPQPNGRTLLGRTLPSSGVASAATSNSTLVPLVDGPSQASSQQVKVNNSTGTGNFTGADNSRGGDNSTGVDIFTGAENSTGADNFTGAENSTGADNVSPCTELCDLLLNNPPTGAGKLASSRVLISPFD